MNDTSFIDLLKKNNLDKISIDDRVVEAFKSVMKKIQAYFNANGYSLERDYKKFFEEYLLTDDLSKKLNIIVNNEPSKRGALGIYYNEEKILSIDEKCLNDKEILEHVLCHELIHFIVMRENSKNEVSKSEFFNEALTEMLTIQILGNNKKSYEPQVEMMKYINLLSGVVNNYSQFLKGNFGGNYSSPNWNSILSFLNLYQNKFENKGYVLKDAKYDKDYINAQRKAIDNYVLSGRINNFSEYLEKINLIRHRVAPDSEYIEQELLKLDTNFINKLRIDNKRVKENMLTKLKDLRKNLDEYDQTTDKNVYEFDFEGYKITIDEELNVTGVPPIDRNKNIKSFISKNGTTGELTIMINGSLKSLNIKDLKFYNKKELLAEKINQIEKIFSPLVNQDYDAIKKINDNSYDLISLKRFTLPLVGIKKTKRKNVYVAEYKDRIELVGSYINVGELEKNDLLKYHGVTATDNGLIYADNVGSASNGVVYLQMNEYSFKQKAIRLFADELNTLDDKKIEIIINEFKKSPQFEWYNGVGRNIRKEAVYYSASLCFDKLPDSKKEELFNKVIFDEEKVVITFDGEKVSANLMFTDKSCFAGDEEILINAYGQGIYNEQFLKMLDDKPLNKEIEKTILVIDEDKVTDKTILKKKK